MVDLVWDLDELAEQEEIVEAISALSKSKSEEVRIGATTMLSKGKKWSLCRYQPQQRSKYYRPGG